MPSLILTGDQPVYTLIVLNRYENSDKFKKIISILGPFHFQVAFQRIVRELQLVYEALQQQIIGHVKAKNVTLS